MTQFNGNELRIDITLHNNRLYELIMSKYTSVNSFCDSMGLSATDVGEYLNLKKSPILRNGRGYRKTCNTIADHFFVDVELLFPLDLYKIKATEMTLEMKIEHLSFHECLQVESGDNQYAEAVISELKEKINRILATLTPREEKIIRLHFGLDGSGGEHEFVEIAEQFGVTTCRIQQIEAKALRKLRQPQRKGKLSDFVRL